MNPRFPFLAATAALVTLAITGCENEYSTLKPARGSPDPVVFSDGFGAGVTFEAFLGTKLDALQIVTTPTYSGTSALEVTVPPLDASSGNFAGGAFTTTVVRDLIGYDALTFWAKASTSGRTLNTAGLGNDNTGESLYEASTEQLALTTSWQKYIVPIPLPAKLDLEAGLFFFAEGLEVGEDEYKIYFDEIRYERTGIVTNPQPFMPTNSLSSFVGASLEIAGTRTSFNVGGTPILMNHLPGYFTFTSSDEVVATAEGGQIKAVGGGTTEITAKLGEVDVQGKITLEVAVPPADAPPVPTVPPGDVISLISNNPSYQNVKVDRWSADFDRAVLTDLEIAGTPVKAYTYEPPDFFCAIEFVSQVIDASSMTHLHLDVWFPDGIALRVKLVDFGADGIYNPPGTPSDDSEGFVTFTGASTPPIVTGSWISLDIPLADFVGLDSTEHLAQLFLQRTGAYTAYVTNIYFHR